MFGRMFSVCALLALLQASLVVAQEPRYNSTDYFIVPSQPVGAGANYYSTAYDYRANGSLTFTWVSGWPSVSLYVFQEGNAGGQLLSQNNANGVFTWSNPSMSIFQGAEGYGKYCFLAILPTGARSYSTYSRYFFFANSAAVTTSATTMATSTSSAASSGASSSSRASLSSSSSSTVGAASSAASSSSGSSSSSSAPASASSSAAAAASNGGGSGPSTVAVGAGVGAGVGIPLLCAIGVIFWLLRRRKNKKANAAVPETAGAPQYSPQQPPQSPRYQETYGSPAPGYTYENEYKYANTYTQPTEMPGAPHSQQPVYEMSSTKVR